MRKLARSHLTLMACVITRLKDGSIYLSKNEKLDELDQQLLPESVNEKKDQQETEEQATICKHFSLCHASPFY